MGERGQILIKDTGIYLYSHWAGYALKNMVQEALQRKQRWTDVEYLTRIIFCEMIKEEVMEETGYGIGNSEHGDLSYPLLIIDVKNQKVKENNLVWSFEDFIKQKFEESD